MLTGMFQWCIRQSVEVENLVSYVIDWASCGGKGREGLSYQQHRKPIVIIIIIISFYYNQICVEYFR
jgi:hypothetical protein